jgi:IclR family pca regulon transcriptional regulator
MSVKRTHTGNAERNMLFRSGDADFMTSLARGLAVIRVFDDAEHRKLTIADVGRLTGLSRGVARRCLYTLQELGYVRSEGRLFLLQPKVLTLGYAYARTGSLPLAAQPILDSVNVGLRQTSVLAVMEGDEVVSIARALEPNDRIVFIRLNVGSRLPAFCTALGRVFLASWSEADLKSYFERVDFVRRTEFTLVTPAKVAHELERVRRSGYSIVDQEFELKVGSIAVPVQDLLGNVVAAICVVFQVSDVSKRELLDRFFPALKKGALRLKDRLAEIS